VLTNSLSLFGPIVLCLLVYLRWQLGDVGGEELASGSAASAAPSLAASNDCSFAPSRAEAALARACAPGLARHEREPEPQWSQWSRAPGVYIGASDGLALPHADATSRGRWLAERIIHGRIGASEPPRRGKKGALDVIVVGANLLGISATVHLMQAGLRVLLVDRQSWAPLDAATHRLLGSRPATAPRTRLPLVTGHHVELVAERADGMLELQAERAAWYTANVIFASHEAGASASSPVSGLRTPIVACAPSASRAA
jgi:hypothetical protein